MLPQPSEQYRQHPRQQQQQQPQNGARPLNGYSHNNLHFQNDDLSRPIMNMRDYPSFSNPMTTPIAPRPPPISGIDGGGGNNNNNSNNQSLGMAYPPFSTAARLSMYPQPLQPIRSSPVGTSGNSTGIGDSNRMIGINGRPKMDLTILQASTKTRKRHKVATSCNRCRQNKRKCDSGVPCSNCQRNKADCIYTDAQLSRSTWGDSPLSKEKVLGVSSSAITASSGSGSGIGAETGAGSAEPKKSKPPTAKKLSAQRKLTNPSVQGPSSSGPETESASAYRTPQFFSPGHASEPTDADLDYRKEALSGQAKQIAKSIRIANPGSIRADRANILTNDNTAHLTVDELTAHVKFEPNSTPNLWPRDYQDADASRFVSPARGQLPSLSDMQDNNTLFGSATYLNQPTINQAMPLQSPPFELPNQRSGQQQAGGYPGFSSFGQRATDLLPQGYSENDLGFANLDQRRVVSLNAPLPSQQQQPPLQRQQQQHQQQQHVQQQQLQQQHQQQQQHLQHHQQQQQQLQQQRRQERQQQSDIAPQTQQAIDSSHPQQSYSSSLQSMPHHPHQHLQSGQKAKANHSISSAAPVSAVGIPAQYPATDSSSWPLPSLSPTTGSDQSTSLLRGNVSTPVSSIGSTSFNQIQSQQDQSSAQWVQGQESSVSLDKQLTQGQVVAPSAKPESRKESVRMQKIAKEMLECRQYDYSIMLPRHISQEEDELWAAPFSASPSDLRGIPRQLLMLPKDANFLVDVYFENACFYYPTINRATVELHLLEPQNPHSLFLLNIVFMTACKHLARHSDIKRAIQFRDRAKEIQQYIHGRMRLSRMLGNILGSQAIYGVFPLVIGMAWYCGTYKIMPTTDEGLEDGQQSLRELELESQTMLSRKGLIPDSVYQQRLWAFWAFYARDSMSRLYFGWPHGMDTLEITAELPRIKGCIGLGGMRKSPLNSSGLEVAVTGKRRGATTKAERLRQEKKLMKAKTVALQVERHTYRMADSNSDDDDGDDDESEAAKEPDSSDDEIGDADAGMEDEQPDQHPHRHTQNVLTRSPDDVPAKEKLPSFTGLKMTLLQRQGKGEDISKRSSGSGSQSAEVKRHLERMKMLLEAEDDVTDGGTYARVLFLEEVKLWSIGRRVGLYLQSRSDSQVAGSYEPSSHANGTTEGHGSGGGSAGSMSGRSPFGPSVSTTVEASRCSERAWLEDNELQGLQADLIAWEQGIPPNLRFRKEVDEPDINHKINGRLGIMTMFYYTITIMLQSSYLPIPQYLKSPSRSASYKSPETLTQEYDSLFSRSSSLACSEDQDGSTPRVKFESDDYFYAAGGSRSPYNLQHHRSLSASEGYFNTAHKICTQLSNVLYHHVELLLDSYPNWCGIQHKLNQTLIAALRVSCLNARLGSNPRPIRDEAKAGFKMGSDLFKRQALLPDPLTVRDWPAEEDVQVMLDLEEEFRELMTTQEEAEAEALSRENSQQPTRANSENYLFGEDDDQGDLPLYGQYESGDFVNSDLLQQQQYLPSSGQTLTPQQLQQQSQGQGAYDIFPADHDHVFGLGEEGFQFDYNMDANAN
ncbi:hypothetical protein EMPS_09289 [Entomortierella parvispora]|uniref:Zn(2)-C6 fungal-type domain-containing protein n=1 Tax=Entomortierella parvispora TaxID=205924 RepID=A0A9P3M0G1_9FUNG|nr:hypothetical protein EMPS_09289 [Entomortierella parvispora]